MVDVISNTSPLLYLYRIETIQWLPELFSKIWIPNAVVGELKEGKIRGYDVPVPSDYEWLQIVDPIYTPPEWFALDLGAGETAVLALALEHPDHIVLLDDSLARRTAQAAGLNVWGVLKILLELKSRGLTDKIEPFVQRLSENGMWLSHEIKLRILRLAGE